MNYPDTTDCRFYRTYNGPIQKEESHNFLEFEKEFIQNKKSLDEEICKSEEEDDPNLKNKEISLNTKPLSTSGKELLQNSNLLAKKFIGKLKKIANLTKNIPTNSMMLLNDLSHFNILRRIMVKQKTIFGIFYWLTALFQKFICRKVNPFEKMNKMETVHPFHKARIAWDIFLCFNTFR